jgi:hypothetical protein
MLPFGLPLACLIIYAGVPLQMCGGCANHFETLADVLVFVVLYISPLSQLYDMCGSESCGAPEGSRRFHELACIAITVCERISADDVAAEKRGQADASRDQSEVAWPHDELRVYANANASASVAAMGRGGARVTSGATATVRIAMELLVRRGRLRAALHFGASRGATVADCAAVAAKTRCIALGLALGRAAARCRTALDAVAEMLPPPGETTATSRSPSKGGDGGDGDGGSGGGNSDNDDDDSAATVLETRTVDHAMLEAFSKELIEVCVEEMALQ